jgi:hypothetical protein
MSAQIRDAIGSEIGGVFANNVKQANGKNKFAAHNTIFKSHRLRKA